MNMEDIMKFKDFALAECATHVAHWNSVSDNLTCHPELDATHVATYVNVGGICNDHLKSFSGTINVDNRLRNKCAIVCVGKNSSLLGERASVRVKRVTHAREGTNFSNKVFSRFTSHFSLKAAAFTLAEVLITLGIIGVVAAMTLPSLVQNYKEKQTVVALKKFYSTMSQAFNSAKSEGIEPEDWATEKTADGYGADEFMSHIKPYLKILKDCNHDKEGCLLTSKKYKTLSNTEGDNIARTENGHTRFILSDGSLVTFFLNSKDCKYQTTTAGNTLQLQNICGGLHVDINGNRGPNTYGKDFFLFYITKYGIIPAGLPEDNTEYAFSKQCNLTQKVGNANGKACTAWVITNENMDYLHCNDLSWDGKHSCKEK